MVNVPLVVKIAGDESGPEHAALRLYLSSTVNKCASWALMCIADTTI